MESARGKERTEELAIEQDRRLEAEAVVGQARVYEQMNEERG